MASPISSLTAETAIKVTDILVQEPAIGPSILHKIFVDAARKNYFAVVQLLLKDDRIDPTFDNSDAYKIAVACSHQETIEVLLKDGRIDPSVNNNIRLVKSAICC